MVTYLIENGLIYRNVASNSVTEVSISHTCVFFLNLHSFRPFPSYQQPHPANQPAKEKGLSDPWRGDWRLHHSPPALCLSLKLKPGEVFKEAGFICSL